MLGGIAGLVALESHKLPCRNSSFAACHDSITQLEFLNPMILIIRFSFWQQRSSFDWYSLTFVTHRQSSFVQHKRSLYLINLFVSWCFVLHKHISNPVPLESHYSRHCCLLAQYRYVYPSPFVTDHFHRKLYPICATATQSLEPVPTATLQSKSSNSRASVLLALLRQRPGGFYPVSFSRRSRSLSLATHAPTSSTGLMISLPLLLSFH